MKLYIYIYIYISRISKQRKLFVVGIKVIYRILACQHDSILEQFTDSFRNFVFDEGQNDVKAYVEPRTSQKVIPTLILGLLRKFLLALT